MTTTTFISGTVIPSTWLNDVNVLTYTVFNAASTAALARTALGLGTMATQAASAVAITGGTSSGLVISGGTISGAAITGGSLSGLGTKLIVSDGGTGASSFTSYAPICGGTTGTGILQSAGIGTSGQVLTSSGAGVIPTFTSIHSFVKNTVLTTGTAATFTTQANTNFCKLRIIGGGGAGGGVSVGGGAQLGGAGGGGGGYLELSIAVSPNFGYVYTIGTAGSPGAAGNNPGGNGGNSTITIGATTYTGGGGVGGSGMNVINTNVAGGAGGTVTNGDVQCPGTPGLWGHSNGNDLVLPGSGASSQFGGGGLTTAQGNGAAGTGFGTGGGGAFSSGSAANRSGGAGTGGILIIDEYT